MAKGTLPLQPIRRLIKKGVKVEEIRISEAAVTTTRDIVEKLIVRLAGLAKDVAVGAKRKTIKKEDIEQAFAKYFVG
ncbi:MAG: histone-like protein [Candidatus Njordarchaeia archaeon]